MRTLKPVIPAKISRNQTLLAGTLFCLTLLLACNVQQPSWLTPTEPSLSTPSRPNILLVVADDLGKFDIGAFGSEIRTPAIDELAKAGVSFNSFYTSATCSPTRAMLLSGTDSHVAGLGNMVEHMAPNQRDKQGYEGYLSHRVVSVATLLRDAGYRTYMSGKWHLGMQDEQLPYRRGFDESFALLQGGSSYFNDMMGIVARAPSAHYRRNGETVTELPEDFYASEYYADFIINQIGSTSSDKPFFAYLAFSAPHWPLQVKDEHLNLYRGRYDQGYDALFKERINAAKTLGIIPEATVAAPRPPQIHPWPELTPELQKNQSRVMEIYAAVVERMDFHLGRVLDHLKKTGQLNNTLVVFMSDNGSDGSDRSKIPGNAKWLAEEWDLGFANMGRRGSYVFPGAGWARSSVGPARMYKEFLSEGGIRSPAIMMLPRTTKKGVLAKELVTVKDIAPTILDYAGVDHPGHEYRGITIEPMSGVSLLPFLRGKAESPHHPDEIMGWELFGQRAIRQGSWKLLRLSSELKWLVVPERADQWSLYNITEDPGEVHDLSSREPEKLAEMIALWEQYAEQHNVILPKWK